MDILSHLGLAFVLMLRPFSPELAMSTDLLSFEHPLVLLFCFKTQQQKYADAYISIEIMVAADINTLTGAIPTGVQSLDIRPCALK